MPDQWGRYSLVEMRTYILRNLTAYWTGATDPVTGLESGQPQLGQNPQFSVQNLNLRLNASATKTSILITAENEKVFAAEVFFDVIGTSNISAGIGQVTYALPPDMCQVRGLWWKTPSLQTPPFNPSHYKPMSYQDQINSPEEFGGSLGRPTWRIVGPNIVLNQDPARFLGLYAVNPQGIWFRYIRFNTYLTSDTQYLDFPYARVAQECVVWDATLDCLRSQDEIVDASGVTATLQYWNQQLELMIRNEYRPPEMQLKGPGIVKASFSGR